MAGTATNSTDRSKVLSAIDELLKGVIPDATTDSKKTEEPAKAEDQTQTAATGDSAQTSTYLGLGL